MSKYSNRDLAALRAKGIDDPKLVSLFGELLAANFSRKMSLFIIEQAITARAESVPVLPELNIHLPAWFNVIDKDSVGQSLWSFIPTRSVITGLANWYRKSFTLGQIRVEMIGCWMDGLSMPDAARWSFDARPCATLPRYRDYIRGRMIIELRGGSEKMVNNLSHRDIATIGKYSLNEAEALLTGRNTDEMPNYSQLMLYQNTPFDIRDKIWAFGWSTLSLAQILPRSQFRHADPQELILLARGYSPKDLYPDLTAKEAHDYLADPPQRPGLRLIMRPRSPVHQWFARRYEVACCRSIKVMRWLHLLKSREVVLQLNQPSPGLGLNIPISHRLDEIQDSHIVKLSDTPKTVFARVDAAIRSAAEAEGSASDHFDLLGHLPDWCSSLPEGFRPLNTTRDLRMEGKVMHHCVGSYVESTRRGQSLCLSAATEFGRSTIEVTLDGKFCMQNKSYKNARAPEEHLELLRRSTGLPFKLGRNHGIHSLIQHWMHYLQLDSSAGPQGGRLRRLDDEAVRRTHTQTPLERVTHTNHSRSRHTPRGAGPLLARINTHIRMVAPAQPEATVTASTDVHLATLASEPHADIRPINYITRESMQRLLTFGGGEVLPTPSEQADCNIDMVLHHGAVRGAELVVQQAHFRPRQQCRSSHSERQWEATVRANEIYGVIPDPDFASAVRGRGLTSNCTPTDVHMELDVDFNL